MTYTKTNLNETTETVVVDMTAEDIENNEATETVVEQNARGYSKTVWNESTPITADKLNKIETGIANGIDKTEQIMEIPITNSEGWQQFRWTRPNCNTISWTRDAEAGKALEVYNETTRHQLLLFKDDGKLTVNGKLEVGQDIKSPVFEASTDFVANRYGFRTFFSNNQEGSIIHCEKNNSAIRLQDNKMVYANPHGVLEIGPQNIHNCHFYTDRPYFYFNRDLYVNGNHVYHEGNKPTPAAIGALPLSGGTLTNSIEVQGESKFYNDAYTDPWHGELCSIKASGHVGIGGSLKINGKLAFSNFGTGGGLNANIHSLALQERIGNGQMITAASDNRIYVGNPLTPLMLESNINPIVNVSGNQYHIYHTGNKPTAGDIGALPLTGGTLTDALRIDGNSKTMTMGTGPNDVFVANSRSGAFLQLKDDGTLQYSDSKIYHERNKPAPWDIGAMAANNPSFEGNMVQHGPNGRNWIYHINADRGTLHIAPHNNGNPDWSKQIMFDRNGFMYCNVGRKVPTWDGDNPTHHMFRYGSGLGGANGYITFSY